jgi:hypothetical protein
MYRRLFLALATAGCLAFAADAPARPKVTIDTSPTANFSSYRTYSWYKSQIPVGMNAVGYQRIISTIDAQLARRGYRQAEQADQADLSLILTIGAKDKMEVQSWGRWGWRQDVYQYVEGQLSLDVFETQTRQAVWHGHVTDTIRPNRSNQKTVDSAIQKLMAKWPGSAGASGAGQP